jgi:hypothetical protein
VNSAADPVYARTLNKSLGEDDTGTVLARCHIWANPYRNGLRPLPKGGCDINIVNPPTLRVNTYS